jgi:hypothetical protein
MDDIDAETKEDKTDYIATMTPELLNLKPKCSQFQYKASCSFSSLILVFIIIFLLFQIVLKLKVIHYKICSILAILVTFSKNKPEEKPEVDCIPNLNYIIDIIQQIKKCKND